MEHYLIVDGSNLLFQMFYGMPASFPGKHGRPIHGTVGFLGALLRVIRRIGPTHIFVCFDGECANPRKELDAEYKANRPDFGDTPEDELPFSQLPDIYAALDYLGICHRETQCCEADDWIAAFACTFGQRGRVTVMSQDSDLFQLITDNVSVFRYRGDRSVICDPAYIRQKLGIEPEQYADFKAMTGDNSDNIKGADKIGPKTAASLLQQFSTLENLLDHLCEVARPSVRCSLEASVERLRRNKKLIALSGEEPLPVCDKELKWTDSGESSTQVLVNIGVR